MASRETDRPCQSLFSCFSCHVPLLCVANTPRGPLSPSGGFFIYTLSLDWQPASMSACECFLVERRSLQREPNDLGLSDVLLVQPHNERNHAHRVHVRAQCDRRCHQLHSVGVRAVFSRWVQLQCPRHSWVYYGPRQRAQRLWADDRRRDRSRSTLRCCVLGRLHGTHGLACLGQQGCCALAPASCDSGRECVKFLLRECDKSCRDCFLKKGKKCRLYSKTIKTFQLGERSALGPFSRICRDRIARGRVVEASRSLMPVHRLPYVLLRLPALWWHNGDEVDWGDLGGADAGQLSPAR